MTFPRPITDHSRLSINTATTRAQWKLAEAIDGYARAGVKGISPWRDQIAEMGLANAAKAIRDADLHVTGVCRGGMFPWADAAGRAAMLEDNRRAIEEAATLEADCLVLVVGGLPAGSKDLAGAHAMVEEAIHTLLPEARTAGVSLAIEPLHPMYAADRACVNTMRHALDICEKMGDGIGVAVDVYHVWWDAELKNQIDRAGKDRLLAFHVCDWLVPTRDLLMDRGMMGDGVIDIPLIRGWVEAAGYDGFHEVEIFSELDWWKRPAEEVVETCKERSLSAV
ncbi:MAG: sugar phosphate isomerase/epimerase [Alphaproteobacteria bacterium]|nr:MAG: sugar phosphate isomerase/epimerase [Alphaproteobacteria bacterium]